MTPLRPLLGYLPLNFPLTFRLCNHRKKPLVLSRKRIHPFANFSLVSCGIMYGEVAYLRLAKNPPLVQWFLHHAPGNWFRLPALEDVEQLA